MVMKRKQALRLIERVLKEPKMDGYESFPERILSALETIMVPNSFCYYATDEYDNLENVLDVHDIDGGIQWESEDET
jgi:hypothetical protein